MAKYLVIQNNGEVEAAAFALMGASTKRGSDDKIGMFGTGTKYAISVLMDGNASPIILSGGQKIRFSLQVARLQGQRFEQVVMHVGNKKTELSFTTTMGLHWNVGHALRELVSNAIDEGGFTIGTYEGLPAGRPGVTRIYIPYTGDVHMFHTNFREWFVTTDRKPVWESKELGFKVYEPIGEGIRVYRRGCLVYSDKKYHATFDYDIACLPVKEDRTTDKHDVQRYIHYLLNHLPPAIKFRTVEHLAANPKQSIEAEGYPEWNCTDSASWKEAMGDRMVAATSLVAAHPDLLNNPKVLLLPDNWAVTMEKLGVPSAKELFTRAQAKGYKIIPREEWDPLHAAMFDNCMELLKEAGIYDPSNLPKFEMFAGEGGVWGEYAHKEDTVYMALDCFKQGQRWVFQMLLEELWHRYTGHYDCTREFQTSIFKGWSDTIGRLLGKAI